MKILELHVQGFRSLKDVTWKPGDLNVVIGPNGSGKSNLLRMLELISISAQGRLGKHVRSLGGIEPLLWDGEAAAIIVGLGTSRLSPAHDRINYDVSLVRIGQTSGFRIERELLGTYVQVEQGSGSQQNLFVRDATRAAIFDENRQAFNVPEAYVREEETLTGLLNDPFTNNKFIPPYCQQLRAWSVYQYLDTSSDAPIRQASVARFEKRVDPDGQNLINVLHTLYTGDREFKREINDAMTAAFGDDFEELVFPPAADQRIQLRVRWKSLSREQSAADLSDGTLRFLFLLTVLASPDPAPLIAIDEPETGLHPSMLPIIGEYAVDAAQRSQVILTTHSPQLLNAFNATNSTTTVAQWSDGQTLLKTLDGEALAKWLEGYSLGHLFTSGELEDMK
jgi:predicted ATPase